MTRHRKTFRWLFVAMLLGTVFSLPAHSQAADASPAPSAGQSQGDKVAPQAGAATSQDSRTTAAGELSEDQLRQAQIDADTRKLYQLSADLRAEVAKTYKESLSLTVLKKAQEVEKLARSLKALMNQEAAANRK